MCSITMAKKTQRHAARYERDQLGCMWGFIRMFNFRHGRSAHKLLVDRRHGSKRVSASGNSRNKLDKSIQCNENPQENLDSEARNVTIAVIKPSVKKLIEEELFVDKETRKEMNNVETGQLSDSEVEGCRRKNQRRKHKMRKKSCDNFSHINVAENAGPEVRQSNQKHHRFMRSLDIDNMIEEFCCEIHRRNTNRVKQEQLNQKHEDYKQRLRELVKFLISQKLLHGNHPREDSEILTSKDLMEVFQILGSDEELFLKLLQDPDLLVPGDVQDLQNCKKEEEEEEEIQASVDKSIVSEQSDALGGRKQCSFFRRKNKPINRASQNEYEGTDHIVILKPGPASLLDPEIPDSQGLLAESHSTRNKPQNGRMSSHFFLSEIKRKLKHAIRKEQRGLPGDVERFPKSVRTKDHFFIEKMARPSMTEKKREKNFQLKSPRISQEHEDIETKQRLPNFYIEARKHLSEMLNNGDIDLNLTSKRDPRSLGRILSLPEYSSPLGSPGIKQEPSCLTAHGRSASADFASIEGQKKDNHLSPLGHVTENADAQPSFLDNISNNSTEPLQPVPSGPAEENVDKVDGTCKVDEIPAADDVETIKEIEITLEEEDRTSETSFDQCSLSVSKSNRVVDDVFEVHDQEKDGGILKQNSIEENQPVPSSFVGSPSHSLAKINERHLGVLDLPEWSSPVSVLAPLFIEEDVSPARLRSYSGEAQLQPLCIQFEEKDSSDENQGSRVKTTADDKELVFEYVKAVLNALDSDWDELYLKSLSSDQLLEPTLMSNVPFLPSQLCPDHDLLFDCINEVLLEFCGEQCGCSPWVSFVKPKTRSVSSIKSIIDAVQAGVYWNLLLLPHPRSLDQIVKKDMAKAGNWLDLRYDVNCIGTDTGELILDELMEEFIFSFLNTIPETNVSSSVPSACEDDQEHVFLHAHV